MRLIGFLFALVMLPFGQSHAATIAYTLTGKVSHLGDFVTEVSVDDLMSMEFVIDTTPSNASSISFAIFNVLGGSYTVGSFTGTLGPGNLTLFDGLSNDVFSAMSSAYGPAMAGGTIYAALAELSGYGGLVDNALIPPIAFTPAEWIAQQMVLNIGLSDRRTIILGTVESITVAAVPLPASLPFLGAGLVMLGLIGRRKRSEPLPLSA